MKNLESRWSHIDKVEIIGEGFADIGVKVNGKLADDLAWCSRRIFRWEDLVIKVDLDNQTGYDQSTQEGRLWQKIKERNLEDLAKRCLVPTTHYGTYNGYAFSIQPFTVLSELVDDSNLGHSCVQHFHSKIIELDLALGIEILDLAGNLYWCQGGVILPDYGCVSSDNALTKEELRTEIHNNWTEFFSLINR